MQGGPGTGDPGLIHWSSVTLRDAISVAYNINRYQIRGPSWTEAETYNINARLAAGTTRDEFRLMIQSLLSDRFRVRTHWERQEMPALVLTLGKGRPKLKESPSLEDRSSGQQGLPPSGAGSAASSGDDSFFGKKSQALFPAGVKAFYVFEAAGIVVFKARMATMSDLSKEISKRLNQVVVDRTSLTSQYEFELAFLSDSGAATASNQRPTETQSRTQNVPSLAAAVDEQLGLKLLRTKLLTEVLVIDAGNVTPVEN
jgi:uncharacterized protein (TIGR03435 family)